MTTDQGFPADRELIESYYDDRSTPNEKDLLHQRDVLAARNPETPEWVLRKVMEGASWEVLAGLAANRACPHDLFPEILERCDSFGTSAAGREAANVVRRSLAANPFASTEVIDGLLGAADQETRRSAAANPKASEGGLATVQKDDADDVRLAATANLSGPPPNGAVLGDRDPRVREAAAHRRDACETLPGFARDPDASVRQAAAANLNTPPETLTDLAGDPEVSVRQAVATNPNTPPETLTILAANPDKGVQAAAAANPNCPKAGEAAKGLMAD